MEKNINIKEFDLREALIAIWNNRKIVIIFIIFCTLIGVIYALITPSSYKSSISLYSTTESSSSNMSNLKGLVSSFNINLNKAQSTVNVIDVINSKRLRKMILRQKWQIKGYPEDIDLISYWEQNSKFSISLNPIKWVRKIIKLFKSGEKLSESEQKYFQELLAVDRLGSCIFANQDKTGLVRVSVRMDSPRLAKDICNYVGEAVIDYLNSVQYSKAKENREFIGNRKKEVNKTLLEAENELTEFRERNRRIVDSPDLQLQLERLMRNVQIQTQVYISLQQQYELAQIEEVKKSPGVAILDVAEIPLLPDKPNRKLIVIGSMFFGIAISPIFLILLFFLSRKYSFIKIKV